MKIHWTPWFNVPNNRRLELFSVGILMFCAFGLIPTTISIILYILVNECFGENSFKCTLNVANLIQIHFSMPVISICEPFACFIWHLFTMIDTRATEADAELGKYRNRSIFLKCKNWNLYSEHFTRFHILYRTEDIARKLIGNFEHIRHDFIV